MNGRAGRRVSDDVAFAPPADDGQAGWVLLPDGRRAYRYEGSDDVFIAKGTAAEVPASE